MLNEVALASHDEIPENLDLREFLRVLAALKRGELTARMSDNLSGPAGKVGLLINEFIDQTEMLTRELERAAATVAGDGQPLDLINLDAFSGWHARCAASANAFIADLRHRNAGTSRIVHLSDPRSKKPWN